MTNALQCIWWHVLFLIFKHPGCYNESPYDLSPKSHDDPRNSLRQLKHRSHEDHKDDQKEQQQWLEYIKNSYAVAKEWMDKDKALWVESKLGLDPNSELK